MSDGGFRLTYATMFNPPDELHQRFDQALAKVKETLGAEYSMIVGGDNRLSNRKFEERCPADTDLVLGVFQQGTADDAAQAVAAAKAAFGPWSRTPWQQRAEIMRRAADLIEARTFELGAAMTLSVGKNRMESIGDVVETADLIRYACDSLEQNDGFIKKMDSDPMPGLDCRNVSALRPYGVWLVISPFNFPAALAGGPAGAALVAGNTVVVKPSSDTPLVARMMADCFLEAGLPEGAFNLITGPGGEVGRALTENPDVAACTFTGSLEVGLGIHRQFAQRPYVHPVILEMGGKNPTIVSQKADLDVAALGVMRSAFGLQGQKCSACSRVFVQAEVFSDFVARLVALTEQIVVGDPTARETFVGPVVNARALEKYQGYVAELREAGRIATGGRVLDEGDLARGHFCAPSVAVDVPADHRLWKHEMFVPIVMVDSAPDLDAAMARANDTVYGLTAGFYGGADEADWFFDHIRAGVTYANRPTGATTGAWPGFQPFGGWQGSGASGKNAGGHYYLPLYLHEQVQARVV